MKTPLQELISKLESMRDNADGFCAEEESYQKAIDLAEMHLPLEKFAIKDAHIAGFYSPPFRRSRDGEAEDYFNQKYKS